MPILSASASCSCGRDKLPSDANWVDRTARWCLRPCRAGPVEVRRPFGGAAHCGGNARSATPPHYKFTSLERRY